MKEENGEVQTGGKKMHERNLVVFSHPFSFSSIIKICREWNGGNCVTLKDVSRCNALTRF